MRKQLDILRVFEKFVAFVGMKDEKTGVDNTGLFDVRWVEVVLRQILNCLLLLSDTFAPQNMLNLVFSTLFLVQTIVIVGVARCLQSVLRVVMTW